MTGGNRYQRIIEHIFFKHFQEGLLEVEFRRDEIPVAAEELGISLPKNLGDVVYTFRYRTELPELIREKAPEGLDWIIRPAGRARYCFVAMPVTKITPNLMLSQTKVPDATPGMIAKYALTDEQALLARIRYNRLIDVFTGLACYSLQSHLRTHVQRLGQVETDEIYVGLDRQGVHFVIPVQAKGGSDILSVVQIEQDFALCEDKFPDLVCRPIGAQFMSDDLIALFEFENTERGIAILEERHYKLVPSDDLTFEEIRGYRLRFQG